MGTCTMLRVPVFLLVIKWGHVLMLRVPIFSPNRQIDAQATKKRTYT